MSKKKVFVLLGIMLTLVLTSQISVAEAHNPQGTSISYNYVDDELSVTFTHQVTDVNSHYIQQIVVEVNSIVVITRQYTSQNTTSAFSAVYSLVAEQGDTIRVTATCSISGQAVQELELTQLNTNTSTTDENPIDSTMLILIGIVAIGVIAIIVVFLKRR